MNIKGFSGMEDVTSVETETNSSILVADGEEMQSTASAVTAAIEGDLTGIKTTLTQLNSDSISCWKDGNAEEFRNGVSELMGKFDNVVTQLLAVAEEYQSFGAEAVQVVDDNSATIRSQL